MSIESMMLSKHLFYCLFLLCLQSFQALGSFPMSQPFATGGQIIRASASVLPMNIQGWFLSGLTSLISLLSKGLSGVLLQHHNLKASILQCSAFFKVQLSHLYMTTGKNHSFDYLDLCWEVGSLLFNILFRFVITLLWRSKHLLISWLQWFRNPRKETLSPLLLHPRQFGNPSVAALVIFY